MLVDTHRWPKDVQEVYPTPIDPHNGRDVGPDGLILADFVDGDIRVDKLLDNIDLQLDWYVPSEHAIKFIVFIRLCLGEEPENSNPKAHYFFMDCIFQQPNVKPFFIVRNIPYEELLGRIAILASREFSKSTLIVYLMLYMASEGVLPGFGKVNYIIYVSDSMRNGVETTMDTIQAVYNESAYLRGLFEDTRLIKTEVNFVRKPRTKTEIETYNYHVKTLGEKPENVPGRMKRTFTLVGIGANTGGRGSRDALARPDGVIFDDLVPSESEASSSIILDKIESTIEADMLPGMNNNKNFSIAIGTPYNPNDPIYRRIEMGTWIPVVFPRGESVPEGKEEDFVSVWPDRHSYKNCRRDYLNAKRAKEAGDSSVMRRLMQEHYLRISSDEDRAIPDELIQWYDRKMLVKMLDGYTLLITTDFTTTSNTKSDFSGIACWAISSNDDLYLLDLSLARLELQQQYDALFRMLNTWRRWGHHIEVGVEIDGQQKAHLFSLKEMMIKKGLYFSFARQKGAPANREGILSRGTGGNKFERFKLMLPYFQNKKVYLPTEMKDTPDMKEMLRELTSITFFGTCISADTKVYTDKGLISIRDIQPKDHVMSLTNNTLQWFKVSSAMITGVLPTYNVKTATGTMILTSTHLVLTVAGYKPVCELQCGDKIITGDNAWNKLNYMEKSGHRNSQDTTKVLPTLVRVGSGYTDISTSKLMGLYQKVWIYITRTITKTITHLVTSKLYLDQSIKKYTQMTSTTINTQEKNNNAFVSLQNLLNKVSMKVLGNEEQGLRVKRREYVSIVKQSSHLKTLIKMAQNTVRRFVESVLDVKELTQTTFHYVKKVSLGILVRVLYAGMSSRKKQETKKLVAKSVAKNLTTDLDLAKKRTKIVRTAKSLLRQSRPVEKCTAVETVNMSGVEQIKLYKSDVLNVENPLLQVLREDKQSTAQKNVDQLVTTVIGVTLRSEAEVVYDISVPGSHNFVLGNGCVVHNSGHDDGIDLFSQVGMIDYVKGSGVEEDTIELDNSGIWEDADSDQDMSGGSTIF